MLRIALLAPFPRVHIRGGAERLVEDLAASLAGVVDATLIFRDDVERASRGEFDVAHVLAPELPLMREAKRIAPKAPRLVTFYGAPLGLVRHGWSTGRRGLWRVGQAAVHARMLARTSRVMAMADAVHAISDCTGAELARQLPSVREKLTVVEPGIDVTRFRPGDAPSLDAALFVGRLESSKGVDVAARVLSRVGLPLVVAGTGALAKDLAAAKLAGVTLVGEVSDHRLVELYRGARLALFPSRYEGYGLVAVEAVACGTPAIASDAFCVRGPASRFILTFPALDEGAMLAAVREAWDRKTAHWSADAAAVVREHHALDVKAREMAALYARVARR
ncbi:MAG: glycosyltransferase family 4 protein [Thermoplasmatota archaeon]